MLIPVIFPVFIGFVISQFFWGITVVGMLSLIQALSTEQIHPSYAPVALGMSLFTFASGQLARTWSWRLDDRSYGGSHLRCSYAAVCYYSLFYSR